MHPDSSKSHKKLFKHSYCINLKTRDDRYLHVKDLSDTLEIPIQFHRVEKHPNGGQQGCFESHLQLINYAYQAGWPYLVIFEDDLQLASGYSNRNIELIYEFIKKEKGKWDLFYLGSCPMYTIFQSVQVEDKIYKTKSICTHAYIISRKFMKKLRDIKYIGIPIDIIYLLATDNSYCLDEQLFIQSGYGSDIGSNGQTQGMDTFIKSLWLENAPKYMKYVNLRVDQLLVIFIVGFLILLLLFIFDPCGIWRWIGLVTLLVLMILIYLFWKN